ncbi:MAG: NAD(P)/FAD-dependent oxidoreductase [Variovorax sp.]|nr:MAG: NAD(P)/FAD-dependent oxidoreductase [Variovorax sp.]
MDEIDCVVIGAGVVGLAVARALALQGREVLVLESENAFGTGTSSRNSEVIHAGIYYPAGSLKARLCVEGKALLYDYVQARGVPFRRCGKLIVATSKDQVGDLAAIVGRAAANGVDDLRLLTGAEAMAMEPALRCLAALHSPSTGIVDSHALMLSLLGDLENAGGMLALKSAVTGAECGADAIVVTTEDGTRLRCRSVVNAAGLGAPALANRFEGLACSNIPVPYFAKGSYFTLSGRAPFTRLIYPVPEPGGLGVHLTLDLGAQPKFGPDVEWVGSADDLAVDPTRGEGFYGEVRKYWPALPDGALVPGYAGIRPKISGPGASAADFMIDGPAAHGVPGLVNLFGIESPGLTSSLAIARYVAGLLA